MPDLSSDNEQWKLLVFERFLDVLRAPYGDFQVVGNLANAINDPESSREIIKYLSLDPVGKYAIANRLSLGAIDVEKLHNLPQDTLGYAYADHLLRNNLKPIPREKMIQNDDDYLIIHLTEVHDIWHVVVDAETTMPGETKLQAFVVAQLRLFRFGFAMLAKNLLKSAVEDLELTEKLMDALAEGWVLGKRAQPLFGVQWNTLWDVPLMELQTKWKIRN